MLKKILSTHTLLYQKDLARTGRCLFISTAVLFALLFLLYYAKTGEKIHSEMNLIVTSLSNIILNLFGISTVVNGTVIRFPSHASGIRIINGCNSLLAIVILLSAVLGVPCERNQKIKGIFLLCGSMFIMNLIRIVSVTITAFYSPYTARFLHDYIWNILFVIIMSVIWTQWIQRCGENRSELDVPF